MFLVHMIHTTKTVYGYSFVDGQGSFALHERESKT